MGLLQLLRSKKRVVSLIIIFLLGSLSGSAALFILAVNNPERITYEIYRYKFAYLRLTRKLITTKDIDGDKVYIYSERLRKPIDYLRIILENSKDDKTVELIDFDKLEAIIKKAYSDFPVFITSKHGIMMPPSKYNRYSSLSITFVGEETYGAYNDTRDKLPSGALSSDDKIYIESRDFKFNISGGEGMIRHEIFHYLENKYRLNHLLPHADADEFEEFKLINLLKKK